MVTTLCRLVVARTRRDWRVRRYDVQRHRWDSPAVASASALVVVVVGWLDNGSVWSWLASSSGHRLYSFSADAVLMSCRVVSSQLTPGHTEVFAESRDVYLGLTGKRRLTR